MDLPVLSQPYPDPAPAGKMERLAYTLRYSAPEVIQALEAGSESIKVDSAADIWAIGVLAFEMLTGEDTMGFHDASPHGAEQAQRDMLAGRTRLPWEDTSDRRQSQLSKKLLGLKRTVVRCLERTPSDRPSAEALLRSWGHILHQMQSHETDWGAIL